MMHIQIEYLKDGCTYIVQPIFSQSFMNPNDGEVWAKYLKKKIEGLINEDVSQLQEFKELRNEIMQRRAEEKAQRQRYEEREKRRKETEKRRKCMERPKIDYVPKGLYIDLEEAYAKYFQQVVTFFLDDKDDFMYMLRLLERWEKKSIPTVLAKGRPDAAYAIAMGLCEHLPMLIYRDDIRDYLNEYKLRIGKLIYASFAALVDSVAAWNNEEKREEVFTYIFTHIARFDDFKRVQNNIQMLAPSKKFTGEPVKIEREMNDEDERAAREAERRRREKERQMLEAEKEAKSLIPLNKDYEQHIFNRRNVDWDCYSIWQLILEENKNIEKLLAVGEYQAAALMFLQLTKSMCRHFVIDRHWEYFDDMYSPKYAIRDLTDEFEKLAKEGKLPKDVNAYLHEAWKEIEGMESCTDYGVPRGALPF